MANTHHYSIQYQYDPMNRLISASIDNQERYQYDYDPTGSLTRVQFSRDKLNINQETDMLTKAENQEGIDSQLGWYLSRENQQYGPYSWEDLVSFVQGNQLDKGDLLWQEGMIDWTRADKIKGLF